jgi:hypothetical protein
MDGGEVTPGVKTMPPKASVFFVFFKLLQRREQTKTPYPMQCMRAIPNWCN